MARSRFLERLGIVRHTIKKDLLFFFLPWFTVMVVELKLCGKYGDRLSGLWQNLWKLITHPQDVILFPAQHTLGLSLFAIGLSPMIEAQATLWRNYSGFVVIKKDHELITHGIYRFTRNPIYLSAIIVFTGLPIYAASLYGMLTMCVQIPLFLLRINLEEKLLAEYFGAEYDAYRRRTKRLIPFLY